MMYPSPSPHWHHCLNQGGITVSFEYKPGDILACYGVGFQETSIRVVTFNPFAPRRLKLGPSHVMIVTKYGDELVSAESTSRCSHACIFHKRIRPGVQIHPVIQRVRDYDQAGGYVDIYRLLPVWTLDKAAVDMMASIIDEYVRREVGYDLGGALLSGIRTLQIADSFPGVDHNEVFCSQLVAALLQRLGRMNINNARKYNPSKLLRQLIKTGVYQFDRRAPIEDMPPVVVAPKKRPRRSRKN